MKKLLVTADDCGLSQGINLATVELHQKGIVTAASVMTNFPASQHALELFAAYPMLQVGVHLNLTDGFALLRGLSRLTFPDGRFRPAANLFARSLAPSREFLASIENELAAQINIVIQAGLRPNHLTTHLHFHTLPALRVIVFRLAERYRVEWVRTYRLRAMVIPFNPFLRKRNSRLRTEAVRVPDFMAVILYWLRRKPEDFAGALANLRGIVELVVHPGFEPDETFPEGIHHTPEERFRETRYLERLWQLLR